MKVNKLTHDFIAIDTNIFERLLNRGGTDEELRTYTEIYILLLELLSCNLHIKLLVDDEGKIDDEYDKHLCRRICQLDNPPQEDDDERTILTKWMEREPRQIEVGYDKLKIKIKNTLLQKQSNKEKVSGTDINFVYIAFKTGRLLITNDRRNIIDERKGDEKRRKELRNFSKTSGRVKGSDILTSKEAYDILTSE